MRPTYGIVASLLLAASSATAVACGGGGASASTSVDGGSPVGDAGPADSTSPVFDGGNLYWLSEAGPSTVSCPTSGCAGAPRTVIDLTNRGPFVLGAGGGFALFNDPGSPATSGDCLLSGCPDGGFTNSFGSDTGAVQYLVSGGDALWTDFVFGGIFRCALTGCGGNPTDLDTTQPNHPMGLAVDGPNLYFGDTDTGLYACTLPDCAAPVHLAYTPAEYVALDATYAYFTAQPDPSKPGLILRAHR